LINPNNPDAVFTGPPPNATEAEINAWVNLWFCHHKFGPRSSTTPPPWVQNWLDNAHAYFTRQTAANASSNNPGTTIPEENQPAPSAATAAQAAPTPDADEAEHETSAWMSSNITIIDGVFHCRDPDEPVPQCVQDRVDIAQAQIENIKQENQLLAAQIASMKDADRKAKRSNNPGTMTKEDQPAPPSVAASNAAPPPDATDDKIADAVHEWISSHRTIVTNGVIRCLDPDQTVPKHVQDRVEYNLAQIASLKDDARKAKRIRKQLPAKRKLPTANAEDTHPSSTTETVNTNDPPAAEAADPNPSDTEENATITIDAQGDTVGDPIVIDESTSNSDNGSADEADKST